MSRSGYSDNLDERALNLWRGTVDQATRGKRGQALLRAMLAALDAMPVKRLIAGDLVRYGSPDFPDGECCALGAVAMARDIDVSEVEPTDRDDVAACFNIAPALAAEIAYVNDDSDDRYDRVGGAWVRRPPETPEQRWTRVRAWVATQIVPVSP